MAPYSGAIFDIVDLSARDKFLRPLPKNSTNFPTTPFFLNISVIVKTKSVAVIPSLSCPDSLKPTTFGIFIEIGCPSIAASASIPPTPQPRTDSAFTIVV